MLPALAGAMVVGGLAGSLFGKKPKYNMDAMNQAGSLIEQQYANVDKYFNEAGSLFETQYQDLYGTQMQDTINSLANTGIYESPVSELALGRKRKALSETYATGKSQLAGQKMQAIGQIDQQKISYLQNLAGIQYNRAVAKQQQNQQIFGAMGSIGSALLGA